MAAKIMAWRNIENGGNNEMKASKISENSINEMKAKEISMAEKAYESWQPAIGMAYQAKSYRNGENQWRIAQWRHQWLQHGVMAKAKLK
jgi:hypothetical protein